MPIFINSNLIKRTDIWNNTLNILVTLIFNIIYYI